MVGWLGRAAPHFIAHTMRGAHAQVEHLSFVCLSFDLNVVFRAAAVFSDLQLALSKCLMDLRRFVA